MGKLYKIKVRKGTTILCQSAELFAFRHKPKLQLLQALPSRCPRATSGPRHSCAHTGAVEGLFPAHGPGEQGAVPAAQLAVNTVPGRQHPRFGLSKVTYCQHRCPLTLCPSSLRPGPHRSSRTRLKLPPEPAPVFWADLFHALGWSPRAATSPQLPTGAPEPLTGTRPALPACSSASSCSAAAATACFEHANWTEASLFVQRVSQKNQKQN